MSPRSPSEIFMSAPARSAPAQHPIRSVDVVLNHRLKDLAVAGDARTLRWKSNDSHPLLATVRRGS